MKFHPTGYPASYKTFVKGELLGRQVEWDEEGNVLSDIDTSPQVEPVAEFPQPIPAPKKKDVTELTYEEIVAKYLAARTLPEDSLPVSQETISSVVISREDLRRPSDASHALPEAPNHLPAIIIGNLIFIALYLLLWWMFYKRKS